MFKSKDDKKDKIIKVQQGTIEKLEKEIDLLKVENAELKNELEFEKNKPKEGYEKAKQMMADFENKKNEYQILIDELNVMRDTYKEKLKEIDELKVKYHKDLKKVVDDMRKNTKTKHKF